MLGVTVGNYEVTEQIGMGGMGAVYLAKHSMLGRPAAVKVLRPEMSQRRAVVHRFFNEARAATAIRHPGIVEIYDFGYLPDGRAYIIMEFLDGESLSARIIRVRRMPADQAVRLVRQIAGALGAAHRQQIVHRDLKPENIFIVPDPEISGGERIKLLDFGIAKLANEPGEPTHTRTGEVIGTPSFMAPEQCRAGVVDARADLYALGCILYLLLCGRPPFIAEGDGDLMAHHLYFSADPPSLHEPSIPPQLEQLILALLEKDPDARPAHAAHVVAAIDALDLTPPVGVLLPSDSAGITMAMPRQSLQVAPKPTTLGGMASQVGDDTAPSQVIMVRRGRRTISAAVAGLLLFGAAATWLYNRDTADHALPSPAAATVAKPVPPEASPPLVSGPIRGLLRRRAYAKALARGGRCSELRAIAASVRAYDPRNADEIMTLSCSTATVSDDVAKRKRSDCAQLQSEERWADLKKCAADLRAIKGLDQADVAAANEFAKQSGIEIISKAQFDQFLAAEKKDDLRGMNVLVRQRNNASMYAKQMDDKWDAAKSKYVNEKTARAKALARGGRCSELRAIAASVRAYDPRNADEIMTLSCSTATVSDAGSNGSNSSASDCGDMEQKVKAIVDLRDVENDRGIREAEQALNNPCFAAKKKILVRVGLDMACRAKRPDKVLHFFKMGGKDPFLVSTCPDVLTNVP
jgi:tRNA A-37 threonylcarbamoyl transferase component Bud32